MAKMPLSKVLPEWPALTTEQLKLLGTKLCHHRHRAGILGGRDPSVRNAGGTGMCGRLIAELLRLRNAVHGASAEAETLIGRRRANVSKKDLVAHGRTRTREPLSAANMTAFCKGQPKYVASSERGQQSFWWELTWDWVTDILLGSPSSQKTATAEQKSLAREIRSFFLGDKRGRYPVCFSFERRACAGPFTAEEAKASVAWVVREQEISGAAGTIVMVSGGSAFPQSSGQCACGLNEFGQATMDMVSMGLKVVFVFPDPEIVGESDASRSVERCSEALDAARITHHRGDKILVNPLSPGALGDNKMERLRRWASEYMNRDLIYTFIERSKALNAETDHPNLLYVSTVIRDRDETVWRPFAERASDATAELFSRWAALFAWDGARSLKNWVESRRATADRGGKD